MARRRPGRLLPWPGRPGRETIARAADGFDPVFVSAGFQRLAQAPNVYVHGPFFDEYVVSPYLVQKLAPGENPLGMSHEEMQEAKFGRPQHQGDRKSTRLNSRH